MALISTLVLVLFTKSCLVVSQDRPFFAGSTGGNHIGQRIPPGTPWPERAEDYNKKEVTTSPPTLEDRVKETTKVYGTTPKKTLTETSTHTVLEYKPNRPSFAGITGGNSRPQKVPPGKPWPSRPEDYEGYTSTSRKPALEDRLPEDTVSSTQTHFNSEKSTKKPDSLTIRPQMPGRPTLEGSTEGNKMSTEGSAKNNNTVQNVSFLFNIDLENKKITTENITSPFHNGIGVPVASTDNEMKPLITLFINFVTNQNHKLVNEQVQNIPNSSLIINLDSPKNLTILI